MREATTTATTSSSNNNDAADDRNALALSVLPMAARYAREAAERACRHLPACRAQQLRDELLGEAHLAVARALADYDPARARLTTYAHWWVRSYVDGYLARRVYGPRRLPGWVAVSLSADGEDGDPCRRHLEPTTAAAAAAADPDSSLRLGELLARLRSFLSPADVELLWDHVVVGLSLREIARLRGLPRSVIQRRVSLALRAARLQKELLQSV